MEVDDALGLEDTEAKEVILGIDLATTRCVAAIVENGNVVTVRNKAGEDFTRSALLFAQDDIDELFLSTNAIDEYSSGQYPPENLIEMMKRLRGLSYVLNSYFVI